MKIQSAAGSITVVGRGELDPGDYYVQTPGGPVKLRVAGAGIRAIDGDLPDGTYPLGGHHADLGGPSSVSDDGRRKTVDQDDDDERRPAKRAPAKKTAAARKAPARKTAAARKPAAKKTAAAAAPKSKTPAGTAKGDSQ